MDRPLLRVLKTDMFHFCVLYEEENCCFHLKQQTILYHHHHNVQCGVQNQHLEFQLDNNPLKSFTGPTTLPDTMSPTSKF